METSAGEAADAEYTTGETHYAPNDGRNARGCLNKCTNLAPDQPHEPDSCARNARYHGRPNLARNVSDEEILLTRAQG
jgi:hypothetical protein